MDLTQYVALGLVFTAITEIVSRVRARDYWVVATILSCTLVGAVCGYFNLFDAPSVEVGILVALAASGALKLAAQFGNKTTPAPSTLTEPRK